MSTDEQLIHSMTSVVTEICALKRQNKSKKKRRIWVKECREERNILGVSKDIELDIEGSHSFMKKMGIDKMKFNCLLDRIAKSVHKEDTLMRLAIPAKLKLLIVLQFMASGCTMSGLDRIYKVSTSAMSRFIPELAVAIYESLQEFVQIPTDENGWKDIAEEFERKFGATNCVGVVRCEKFINPQWSRYGKNTCILLWTIVDAVHNLIFMDVEVCKSGENDVSFFATSLENKSVHMPKDCYFVEKNGSNLKKYSMIEHVLSENEEVYSEKLESVFQVADVTFDMMKNRFNMLSKPVTLSPDSVIKLMKAAGALYNWTRKSDPTDLDSNVEHTVISASSST